MIYCRLPDVGLTRNLMKLRVKRGMKGGIQPISLKSLIINIIYQYSDMIVYGMTKILWYDKNFMV